MGESVASVGGRAEVKGQMAPATATGGVKSHEATQDKDRITTANLRRMLESQQYKCALSGDELTPELSALDHKVPLSEGGSHLIGNVQWVTPEINRMKGSLSQEAFISICQRVAMQSGPEKIGSS